MTPPDQALLNPALSDPAPVELGPYAEFLLRHLLQPCGVWGGAPLQALAETGVPFEGDHWFWTDDNAKVLELLSVPALWRRYPDAVAAVLGFVRAMCEGPFIFRRISAPRLELAAGTPEAGTWVHSLMHVVTDLRAGKVMLGLRFHDGRTARNVLLTGNYVSLVHRGEAVAFDVEDAITEVEAHQVGGRLVLYHAGELRRTVGDETIRLGRVSYTYTVTAASMRVGVEVALELDPAAEVSEAVLTIGHDNLSHGETNVDYNRLAATPVPGAPADVGPTSFAAGEPGHRVLPLDGAGYYAISKDEMPGFALGVHTLPRTPRHLAALAAVVEVPGWLHWVGAEYRFTDPEAYARLLTAEFARPEPADGLARDLSISYDYGVEINGFAKCYAALPEVPEAAAPGLRETLRTLVDRGLNTYFVRFMAPQWAGRSSIFSRQLAFVVLAAATMLRATGEARYRQQLAALCDELLAHEKIAPGLLGTPEGTFLMGRLSIRDVHVDCHSASLLALVQAARHLDDPRLAAAVDRGLLAYCMTTGTTDMEGGRKVDALGVAWTNDAGEPRVNNAFWNYHAGLTLRLFRALREAEGPLRDVLARHADRIAGFEAALRFQVARSTHVSPDGLEIRTSFLSGETNSETQPWVALGLAGHPQD